MKIRNNAISASQSVSGTFTQSLSGYNQFNLNLTGNTKLEYSNATTGVYNFVVNGGSYLLNLGTSSNYQIISSDLTMIGATGAGLSGSFTLRGIYDGSNMLMTYQSPFITMPKGGAVGPNVVRGNKLALDASNATSYPGSGSTWYDLSGNGSNITLYNSPTYNAGGWLQFNGTNQYGDSTSSNLNISGNSFSLEMWINLASGSYIPVSKSPLYSNINDSNNYVCWWTPSSYAFTSWNTSGLSNYNIFSAGSSTPINTWYQWIITYDGSAMKFYNNGTLLSTTTSGGPYSLFSTGAPFRLGHPLDIGGSYTFINGKIGVVNLWNSVISSADIAKNYAYYSTIYV